MKRVNPYVVKLCCCTVLICTASLCAASLTPQPGQRIVSDASGDRLVQKATIEWVPSGVSSCSVPTSGSVCLGSRAALAQEIDGYGGSFMRAGATLLSMMSTAVQETILDALFDPEHGAGLTLGKVPIGATDFGVPVWYTYEDVRGNFSIAYDVSGDGAVMPFVKRAAAKTGGTPLWLQATMDYPPEYMINSTTPMPHPTLNTSTLQDLARYYLNFSLAYRDEGVPLRYLSMFNEPYSSYITPPAEQIVSLLVDHVGPLFRQTPGAPNLTWGEQYGRMITLATGPAIMNAPGVQDYVDVLFYHGYDCGDNGGWYCTGDDQRNTTCPHLDWAMSNITAYKAMYPHLKMWMTEVCYAIEFEDYPSNTSKCPALPRLDFEDGLQWGRMLFGDMQSGASGWVYWNLLLNMSGGPYLFSPQHNDPWNNIQQPVVVLDPDSDAFHLTGCYYFLAHFGRYVKRGMYHVGGLLRAPNVPLNVYVVVFTNRTTTSASSTEPGAVLYVVQWMNDGPYDTNVTMEWVDDGAGEGWTMEVPLPAISMTTLSFVVVEQPSGAPPGGDDFFGRTAIIGVSAGCGAVVLLIVFGVVVKRRSRVPQAEYEAMESRE